MNRTGKTAQGLRVNWGSGREQSILGNAINTKKQPGVVVHACAHTCNSSSSRELTGSQAPGQCMLHGNTLFWNPRQQRSNASESLRKFMAQWRNSLAGNKSNKDSICFILKNWIRQQRICCFSESLTRTVWAINTRGRKDKRTKETEADAGNLHQNTLPATAFFKTSPGNTWNKSASWSFPTSANIHLSKILILQKDCSNTHVRPRFYLWRKSLNYFKWEIHLF